MYWRAIRESDLRDCLDLQPVSIGDQIAGPRAALRVWRDLLESPGFLANVIESDTPIAGQTILGCGMGVFVTSGFADEELANPRAGLNARIVAAAASGETVVLDRAAIAAGNARQGLDFVNLYGAWREGVLDPDQLAEVHALLGTSFVEHFAGYRFNRVLKETIGDAQIALARATGTYRVVAEFTRTGSALALVTPEHARTAPYSVAARMYRYQSPVLRLRPAEQNLLQAAFDGQTDAELGRQLGLSVEAVKKRWVSVFDRVAASRPQILSEGDTLGKGRGPQKRHRVVAYVRAHPEELRPYAWE